MNKPEPLPEEKQGINEDMMWSAVYFARQAIYGDKSDNLIASISKAENKVQFIGRYVADLVGTMVRDAAEKQSNFNRRTVQEVFKQVILDVIQLAAVKGVMDINSKQQAQKAVNSAFVFSSEAYARMVKSNRRRQGLDKQGQEQMQGQGQMQDQEQMQAPEPEQPRGLLSGVAA